MVDKHDNKIENWKILLDHDEIDSIRDAILSRNVSQGVLTRKFEEKLAHYLDVPYVTCTTSGTVSLMISLMALGVNNHSEVIIPNRTWIATAHAALILGAKVRLVDVRPDKLVIDEESIIKNINDNTKVIIPVHLNGRACDMEKIMYIANKYKLNIVEDACQAFLSKYNNHFLGTLSKYGCFSLGIAKLITTGQGGFIVSHNENDTNLLRQIRDQAINSNIDNGDYNTISGNFKFTDIQAAIGLAQLKKVDSRINNQLNIYKTYKEKLKSVTFLRLVEVDINSGCLPLRSDYLCAEPLKFIEFMKDKGVDVKKQVPSLNEYPKLRCEKSYINSEKYSKYLVNLPSGPDQDMNNINKTIDIILSNKHLFTSWDNLTI